MLIYTLTILNLWRKIRKKDGSLSNPWFPYFKDEEAVDIYKKVAKDNVFIDGETITISYRGKNNCKLQLSSI